MSRRIPLLMIALLALTIMTGSAEELPTPDAGETTPTAAVEIAPADTGETAPADGADMPVARDSALPVLDDNEDAVRDAQQSLANLGFYDDAVDGKFGKHTEAALRAFQRQSGLNATGHLDEYTRTLLLKYAEEDINPKSIQQRLIDLGYLQGTADGKLGEKSTNAVKIFQRINGLKVTGTANAETVLRLFSDQVETLPEGLSAGSKGEDVEMLQRNLLRYGFMTEALDGEYGKTTTSAVQAFQQHLIDQGIPVEKTGVASPLTLYCLYSEAYSSYLRDVSEGMTDAEAGRVERRLNDLGYMDAAADDTFDDYAREALVMFQWKAGVDATGVADRRTVDALFSATAPRADHCAPHEIAKGDSGLAVMDVEAALVAAGYTTELPDGVFGDALEKALSHVADYLKEEDSPDHLTKETVAALQNGLLEYRAFDADATMDAARVQSRLYTLFYLDKAGIDGMIGDNTLSALHEFQKVNGLPRTDAVDQATTAALFSTAALSKPYRYRVDVSIARQTVEVYSLGDDNRYELVKTFKCSTGLHDSTPRGIYLEGHPVNRWHYFKKFFCWAQYSYKIVDDIMFHSVIYGSKDEKSLRRSSQRNLGNPASHGCVRLSVEDAKWLYEHCGRGQTVIVIQ